MLENEEYRAELIEQYLSNLMSDSDRANFEYQLTVNEQLSEEFELSKDINLHLSEDSWSFTDKTSNELEAFFKSKEAENIKNAIENSGKTYFETRDKQNRRFRFPYFIAASFTVLLCCLGAYLFFQEDDLFQENYSSQDLPSLVSRGDNQSVLNDLAIAFQSNDFEQVVTLYNSIMNQNESLDETIFLYGGVAYIFLNDYEKASSEFDKMLNSNSINKSKALWFKAIMYMKSKDKELLSSTLREISKDSTNFNYNKAIKILEEI